MARVRRALVLGGGGVAGIAWLTGVLTGIARRAGVDLRDADRIVGTSAGATVAAQLVSDLSLAGLYERQTDPGELVAELTPAPGALAALRHALAAVRDAPDAATRAVWLGERARVALTPSFAARRAVIAQRLPQHTWDGADALRIVAVNAATGAPRTFGSNDGVALVDAVAASSAVPCVWPVVALAGAHWIDGGVRAMDNLSFAADASRVVLISPTGHSAATLGGEPLSAALKAFAGAVKAVIPDAAAQVAIGADALDPDVRAASAAAGLAQGHDLADEVAAFWQ